MKIIPKQCNTARVTIFYYYFTPSKDIKLLRLEVLLRVKTIEKTLLRRKELKELVSERQEMTID